MCLGGGGWGGCKRGREREQESKRKRDRERELLESNRQSLGQSLKLLQEYLFSCTSSKLTQVKKVITFLFKYYCGLNELK